jgi:predicted small lipoprotein YifL
VAGQDDWKNALLKGLPSGYDDAMKKLLQLGLILALVIAGTSCGKKEKFELPEPASDEVLPPPAEEVAVVVEDTTALRWRAEEELPSDLALTSSQAVDVVEEPVGKSRPRSAKPPRPPVELGD